MKPWNKSSPQQFEKESLTSKWSRSGVFRQKNNAAISSPAPVISKECFLFKKESFLRLPSLESRNFRIPCDTLRCEGENFKENDLRVIKRLEWGRTYSRGWNETHAFLWPRLALFIKKDEKREAEGKTLILVSRKSPLSGCDSISNQRPILRPAGDDKGAAIVAPSEMKVGGSQERKWLLEKIVPKPEKGELKKWWLRASSPTRMQLASKQASSRKVCSEDYIDRFLTIV